MSFPILHVYYSAYMLVLGLEGFKGLFKPK